MRGIARLGRAPEPLQKALAEGTVPVETAKLVCAVPNPKYREKVALHVIVGDHYWGNKTPFDSERGPLSYRQTKDLIRDHCMVELKAAAFDPADAKLLPGVGTCAECPKRVGNLKATEPELYEGARDDMCMDPGCYRDKLDAAGKQKIAAAKEIGRKVLSASESNALFEQWSPDRVRYDCPYIDLDESASRETHGENNKRFRTMLAKELDTVIIGEERRVGADEAIDPGSDRHRPHRQEPRPVAAATWPLRCSKSWASRSRSINRKRTPSTSR